MEYKNQHIVPQSFLKAWIDPETPEKYEPYVWLISKDGKTVENKAPKNVLSKTDFYTVFKADGKRDVELEKRLSKIEGDFISVRDKKLFNNEPLSDMEHQELITFIALGFARTKWHKESQTKLWEDYERLISRIIPEIEGTEFHKKKELQAQPLPYFLFHFLEIVLPYLNTLKLSIYHTANISGFITSDNPCLWLDPTLFETDAPITFFGIGSPSLNIIMPISPQRVVILSKEWPEGYFSVENMPEFIDDINAMMVSFCEEAIINNSRDMNEYWFRSN